MPVRHLLVTAPDQVRLRLWLPTAMVANWIEGRPNRHGSETWAVTVMDGDADSFLQLAERLAVTVEEIDSADGGESYRLLVGAPGSGWG
jgi:hypothetical protein